MRTERDVLHEPVPLQVEESQHGPTLHPGSAVFAVEAVADKKLIAG
jgi:hypothetical protein